MSNDSAHGRAVGTHPGSFSGGEYCRWTSWAQTDSDALCARRGTVDSQHRRAMAHAAAELPELQNCASADSDLGTRCGFVSRADGCSHQILPIGGPNKEKSFIAATFVISKGGGVANRGNKHRKEMEIKSLL